ncbi:hypothetical protein C5167_043282 [Papaver somniferum]|uniref:Phospholipase n=1 Tax=Papaver somniferum TaxID=3469 RepID=A0A4Y7L977_PAPSO|nr:hypothetical protein C5167_043282 [Papaver somniferum]
MSLEEQLIKSGFVDSQSEPLNPSSSLSSTNQICSSPDTTYRIFEELPKATVISVTRPDAIDFSLRVLSYTIEFQYKEFNWILQKKASQLIYLHLRLKKRAIIEEFHDKQEQVKEWLHCLGIGDYHPTVIQDDDEADDENFHLHHKETTKSSYVPSRAALPFITPALGRQKYVMERAKVAMQEYLNHFLGNMDIVNSREVCNFLEVSKLSFAPEYGPKLKEGYVMVNHPTKIPMEEDVAGCCMGNWFNFCSGNWQKVWAVLKPGFLALLEDPFDTQLLDIVLFDVLPTSNEKGESHVSLVKESVESSLLHYSFLIFLLQGKVSSGSQSLNLRTRTKAKVREWVTAISDAGLGAPEGWCYPQRFGSFAPPRGLTEDASQAQWFVDGKAAFEAIALAIEEAKSEIFITDWWLCPELYLRRPFNACASSRLDFLLEAKAKQGVKIYILLYKEVPIVSNINSAVCKQKLLSIHENVTVLRYPDHISTGIYLWSHHEKLVIIDYRICFIGGLDLCFGRYDNFEHKVGDFPATIWPGKDYYNPRESQPNSWEDTMTDELERGTCPRMPWHDVHCALWGPPCLDIARHFVLRWNLAKRNKAQNLDTIPLLIPRHYMERSTKIECESKSNEHGRTDSIKQNSFSSLSPLEDMPLLFPAEGYELDAEKKDPNVNGFNKTQVLTISRSFSAPSPDSKAKPSQSGIQYLDEWWGTQERGDQVVSSYEARQVGPRTSCHCQVIRSVSQWSAGTSQTEDSIHNAYCSLIEQAEHYIYIENQFFISGLSQDEMIKNRVLEAFYKRIIRADKEQKCFRVIIVIPLLPDFEGGLDGSGSASARALIHWQYRTICRGRHSILQNLYEVLGPRTHDYISFYSLRNYGRLRDDGPLVTNQVYVHSKIMIIDDRTALIGSSNINDRSLLGSRDSEIGIVIEDKEFVDSSMNGKPWKAGKFCFSLRLSLWSEHLGLCDNEISKINDLVADKTYTDIWMTTAKTNTDIYQDIFACIPNDHLHSRSEVRQSMAYWKEKLGHTTNDLGVASQKIEAHPRGDSRFTDPMEKLKSIRGHLVLFPLEFMCQEEDLRPMFNHTEFYVKPQVYH